MIPRVVIISFGYLHGPPPPSDIVVDVRRHLRDPHIDPGLRQLTGRDPAVREKVMDTPGAPDLINGLAMTVAALLRGAVGSGGPVTVAIGCAGGRHRSVVLADVVVQRLSCTGVTAISEHSHIAEPVVTTVHPPAASISERGPAARTVDFTNFRAHNPTERQR